jgi:TPR repeat protein
MKETAEYLRELAIQGNPDAMYAYATFYYNVYTMSWHKSQELFAWKKDVNKNEWYSKAILAYEEMNTSDPEILVRIAA